MATMTAKLPQMSPAAATAVATADRSHMAGAVMAGAAASAEGASVQHKPPLPPGLTSVGWLLPTQEHELRYGGNGGGPQPAAMFFLDQAFIGTPLSALTVVAPTAALGERVPPSPDIQWLRAVRSHRALQSDTHESFRVLDCICLRPSSSHFHR